MFPALFHPGREPWTWWPWRAGCWLVRSVTAVPGGTCCASSWRRPALAMREVRDKDHRRTRHPGGRPILLLGMRGRPGVRLLERRARKSPCPSLPRCVGSANAMAHDPAVTGRCPVQAVGGKRRPSVRGLFTSAEFTRCSCAFPRPFRPGHYGHWTPSIGRPYVGGAERRSQRGPPRRCALIPVTCVLCEVN